MVPLDSSGGLPGSSQLLTLALQVPSSLASSLCSTPGSGAFSWAVPKDELAARTPIMARPMQRIRALTIHAPLRRNQVALGKGVSQLQACGQILLWEFCQLAADGRRQG